MTHASLFSGIGGHDLVADLPPEFYAWENRDNFAECGADLLTLWCGDKWKTCASSGQATLSISAPFPWNTGRSRKMAVLHG